MNDDSSNVSAPRLARLVKGDQGYGFNLHGDKSQPGQIISAVDKDSPAEIGGLREGDRLIEVNGTNVENISHGEVVKKIKESPNETSLLVCDKETLAYLKKNDRICTADMVNLSTVFVEPEPLLANGDAKPDLVAEKIEESEPVAVEESAPPPAPVSKEETDAVVPEPEPSVPAKCAEPTGPEPTPDEAVKELNSVLDEQEAKPAEVPVVEPEPPQTKEPEVPKAEPAKSSDSDLQLDMKSARPSRNLRKSAKQSGEAWKNKVNVLDSL